MSSLGHGVEFLARYAELEGGLSELSGDGGLLLVPATIREALSLPEELRVTSEPEVARDDGSVLVFPGHPLLRAAAESVLRTGDVGGARLVQPPAPPPSIEVLEAKARQQIFADHGRIDIAGAPAAADVVLLRLAALVTYGLSVDEFLQEVEELSVDATTGREVPAELAAVLDSTALEPTTAELGAVSTTALKAAAQLFERRTTQRAAGLRRGTSLRLRQQLAVVDDYYQQVLASLETRRLRALERRAELISSEAQATELEWARRRAEVEEEFTPSIEARPFRLHVLLVPAYRVPCVIRRGAREYPLALHFVRATATYLLASCPSCGALAMLVAGKDRLGCRGCLGPPGPERRHLGQAPTAGDLPEEVPPAAPEQVEGARPTAPAAGPPPDASASGAPGPSAPPVRHAPRPGRHGPSSPRAKKGSSGRVTPKGTRSGDSLQRTGVRLAMSFWESVWSGEAARRARVAPGSPLAALFDLYGAPGPALVVRAEQRDPPAEIGTTTEQVEDGLVMTEGSLHFGAGERLPFILFWRPGSGALIEVEAIPLELLGRWITYKELASVMRQRFATLFEPPPPPIVPLAPVPAALLETSAKRLGLPYAARCMAAWWHLEEAGAEGDAALFQRDDPVMSAAIESVVLKRAGLRITAPTLAEDYGCSADALRRLARRLGTAVAPVHGLRW